MNASQENPAKKACEFCGGDSGPSKPCSVCDSTGKAPGALQLGRR